MRHKLTALQYLQLVQNLPNPQYHYDSKQLRILRVAYLPHNLDQDLTKLTLPGKETMTMVEAKTLDFELVPNHNVWFWQPVDEIVIIPVEKGPARKNW